MDGDFPPASDPLVPAAEPAAPPAAPPPAPHNWHESFLRVWVPTLVVALFIITFNLQAFEIPSASMENTLLIGDHLLVDRVRFAPAARWGMELPYHAPRDGDVVVFMSVTDPGLHVVKRVMGVPGDRIHLEDKVVYRNGVPLNEPYAIHAPMPGCGPYVPSESGRDDFPAELPSDATPEWAATLGRYLHDGDIVVPPRNYFVMGDDRECSYDSRYWGFVPQANLIGRPIVVYWSYRSTEEDYLDTSLRSRVESVFVTLWHAPTRTRWARTMHLVR